jgi:MinD-like ATPase involved in chromosome partitioning or flagellar assembly
MGEIYTFYSFKGGVGRTMAVANVATLLARSGKSVLIIDWDLEAPGLHKFFVDRDPHLAAALAVKPGIIEILTSVKEGKPLDWKECVVSIGNLGASRLDLINAGRWSQNYSENLQQIDWAELYERHEIGELFERLRDEWKKTYDYVLLDSRTGVTDIGDVCTAVFPDVLVVLFVTNVQNLEGSRYIIERARRVHQRLPRDRMSLLVLPVLARDELFTEYDLSEQWKKRAAAELGFALEDWLPKAVNAGTYFSKVFVPYFSKWSFGENLPVAQKPEELSNPSTISSSYARLASLIQSSLDWGVLERAANVAEVEELRARAAQSEESSAAAIAEVEELRTRAAQSEKATAAEPLVSQLQRWHPAWIAVAIAIVLGGAAASWFAYSAVQRQFAAIARQNQVALDIAVARQKQAEDEAVAARMEAEAQRAEVDQQKRAAEAAMAQLNEQNAALSAQIARTQQLLEDQRRAAEAAASRTQRQLDEVLKKFPLKF